MASFNRVVLLGNLTRDIELRFTPGGTPVTEVGLAVNDRRKNQAGEWVEEATFVDITLWGRTAEVASEYLSKGSQVLIEGRLKLDTWETDGQKRSKLRVIGERMQMLGSRGGSGGGGGYAGGDEQRRSVSEPSSSAAGQRDAHPSGESHAYNDSDIPF
ncbi:MAG: single-stranded DNA-binding protein [Pirellulaceae bacterium]